MRQIIKKLSLTYFPRLSIAAATIMLILFACSQEKDMRKGLEEKLGKPDIMVVGGTGPYQYATYLYLQRDINVGYQFRKSASGCGGSGKWYVDYRFPATYDPMIDPSMLYTPVTFKDYSPVEKTVPGEPVQIEVELNDPDGRLQQVGVAYWQENADTSWTELHLNDSLYVGNIPADIVTPPEFHYRLQLEYFVSPTVDNPHREAYLPSEESFVVTVESDQKTPGDSTADSTQKKPATIYGPVYEEDNTAREPGIDISPSSGQSPIGP